MQVRDYADHTAVHFTVDLFSDTADSADSDTADAGGHEGEGEGEDGEDGEDEKIVNGYAGARAPCPAPRARARGDAVRFENSAHSCCTASSQPLRPPSQTEPPPHAPTPARGAAL